MSSEMLRNVGIIVGHIVIVTYVLVKHVIEFKLHEEIKVYVSTPRVQPRDS